MITQLKKHNILIFIMMIILSVCMNYINSEVLQFSFIIVLFIIIAKKAKISFFTVLTFILIFTLFQEFMLDVFNISTGMLTTGTEADNAFKELFLCTNIFCLIEYIFMITTNIIENEKKLYLLEITMTDFWAIFFCALSLIITILIFPSMPTFKTTQVNRFNSGFLPFSGFAGLALFLIGITYDSAKKIKIIYAIDFFVVFWFFGHAERVEALGVVVYILLKYLNQNSLELNNIFQILKRHFKLVILVFLLIGFLVWIGLTRSSGHSVDISLSYLLNRIFIQSTASDVAYIFNCSIDLWKNGNLFQGETYLSYLSKIIPFIGEFADPEVAIKQYYFTVGGCPFFAEIIMNFGMKGITPMIALFFSLHAFILKKVNKYRAIFWIPILIEIFRTAWYGWTGWFRLSFFIVPIVYILITRFKLVILR